MKTPLLLLFAVSLTLAALSGCFVHTYTATFPNSGCETSTAGNAALSASNTSCGGAIATPSPATQP